MENPIVKSLMYVCICRAIKEGDLAEYFINQANPPETKVDYPTMSKAVDPLHRDINCGQCEDEGEETMTELWHEYAPALP